jgi:hypothetical protein
MRLRRGERGEGKLGCLFGLIVLGIAVLIAWKIIPVKVHAAELRQVIVDEAKAAGTHNNDQMMGTIMAKVRDTGVPVTADDVKIVRANSQISVDVEYDVPLDFLVFNYKWHEHLHAENPIF